MTFQTANAAVAAPVTPMWEQPKDAPDLLEGHGSDRAIQAQRISILCEITHAARNIWAWGPGATRSGTLEQAVNYYCDGFRCREHLAEHVHAFVAAYVPGGRKAVLRDFDRDVLRELMSVCTEHATAKAKAIRAMTS